MAIFDTYFDAGASAEDPTCRVLSVAGYISTRAKWKILQREWQKVVDKEGVSALHMNDLAHSVHEFADWKGDEPRRQRFLAALAKIIKKRTHREFSCSVFLDGYRAVNACYELQETIGRPYVFAAWRAIDQAESWLKKRGDDSGSLYIFEKGDLGQVELIDHLKKMKVHLPVDPIFMEQSWIEEGETFWSQELQTADFIAYEHSKNLTDVIVNSRSKARGSLQTIAESRPTPVTEDSRGYVWYGVSAFEAFVRALRIKKRQGEPEYVRPPDSDLDLLKKALRNNLHIRPRPGGSERFDS